MKQALGLIEIEGLSTAVVVADTMAKAANIQILEIENTKGAGYMTIKVSGDVGAVNAAVNAGKQVGIENQRLVSWKVIPRPSDYVEKTFCSKKKEEVLDQLQEEKETNIAEEIPETVKIEISEKQKDAQSKEELKDQEKTEEVLEAENLEEEEKTEKASAKKTTTVKNKKK